MIDVQIFLHEYTSHKATICYATKGLSSRAEEGGNEGQRHWQCTSDGGERKDKAEYVVKSTSCLQSRLNYEIHNMASSKVLVLCQALWLQLDWEYGCK